jgi:hypothetical protein
MSLTIKQIEEIASESKYLRGEFKDKLYGGHNGDVSFDKMMDFLLDDENRQTVEMMVNLAKKLAKS